MEYHDFIKSKQFRMVDAGFKPANLNDNLWLHQPLIVDWACRRGRAAVFADTGLGKTLMQLEWANQVASKTGKPVLLFAPLAVGKQTEKEASKFGITGAKYVREQTSDPIQITNYEMIGNFNPGDFSGVVLDESSILKGQTGAYRKMLTEFASAIDYRLSCTATPSPNDYMELGTQCEFLGIMSQVEMLAMFFTHDGSETQKWRLKGHAEGKFWEWLATWAVVISNPADLGLDGSKYELPKLTIEKDVLRAENHDGFLPNIARGLTEVRRAKKVSVESRVKACADWVNSLNEPCVVWAESNEESAMLANLIDNAVEVAGSHKQDVKEDRLLGFADGKYQVIVSKASIAGFGLNWQNACKMAFVGPTYSFEQFYQAVRREYRFGQSSDVLVKVFMTEELEGVHDIMVSKMEQDKVMRREMIKVMADAMKKEIKGASTEKTEYNAIKSASIPDFL